MIIFIIQSKHHQMTVRDLIDTLQDMDENMEVSLAFQPNWPFEHSIGSIVTAGDKVYIGEETQIGYLSGEAATELGWN